MRAVIYARYSSDLQREESIEDQIRLCRQRAATEDWDVSHIYSDRASSGSSRFRPAYQDLLNDARARKFDIVVAEALDRLSRDQEDVANLFKTLTFAGIRLITLAEGEISELHVGLKGTMNALFLKDLAAKTHRGMSGRVKNKRAASGLSYGYAIKREFDTKGEPIRGGRVINTEEATVVIRIFSEFSTGTSPRAIAKRLNSEGIMGPGGRPWQDTTIRGHAARGTGILRNELYIGRMVWNRQHFMKDPATGKRQARMNPLADWIIEDVPDLRIIDEALWQSVNGRLNDISASPTATGIRKSQFWLNKRPKHILSGIVVCGCCHHPLAAVGKDYLRCARADRNGLCTNTRGIRRPALEDIVLKALQQNLMHPDLVAEFIRAFQEEMNKERATIAAEQQFTIRRLAEISRQYDGLITAIAEGLRADGLQQRLSSLEAEKMKLEAALKRPTDGLVHLHPELASGYRRRVAALRQSLETEETRPEALEIIRSLIERVIVQPREDGSFEIELEGEIARMVEIGLEPNQKPKNNKTALQNKERRSVKMVAGTRFELMTFRL
jgi:DNA invertase Pin-like site-specific DNA recombinase